jgi:hypothetical protein
VGRHPEDIVFLNTKYKERYRTYGHDYALNTCIEANRPPETNPVDGTLVTADVAEIRRILSSDEPPHRDLFRILLRRSDAHIKQINVFYQGKEKMSLDEGIRRCQNASKMTRKIAEHAVRSAMYLDYRDVMLLRRAMGAENIFFLRGREELLALRIVRAHWYRHHWRAVKQKYLRLKGNTLVDKVKRKKGLLGDILVSLVQVW